MKKSVIIILIIVGIIAAVIAGVVISQYDNITAVIEGIVCDEHEIEQKAQQSEQNVKEYLENNNIGTIRPLTEEEALAVTSGEITEADAVKIVTGTMTLEQAKQNKIEQDKQDQSAPQNNDGGDSQQPEDNGSKKPQTNAITKPDTNADNKTETKPHTNNNNTQKPQQKPDNSTATKPADNNEPQQEVNYDVLISEKVAQLYVIKANFYAEFNNAWAAEKAAYLALPKEQRGKGKKLEIVRSKMDEGLAMEQKYDAQVDAVVSELRQLLTEAGRSTELADAVKDAYDQEKKSKKAQLINKYF